jgi:hypothetical protein
MNRIPSNWLWNANRLGHIPIVVLLVSGAFNNALLQTFRRS